MLRPSSPELEGVSASSPDRHAHRRNGLAALSREVLKEDPFSV
jgi:hypothetical protein